MTNEAITLEQAQTQLAALLSAQASNTLSVSYNGRSKTYRSSQDLRDDINYWSRIVAEKTRVRAGRSRHGHSVANFTRGR